MKALVKYYIHGSVWSAVSGDKHCRRLAVCFRLWGNFCLYVFLKWCKWKLYRQRTQLPGRRAPFSEYTLSSLMIVKDFAKWHCGDDGPHPQPFHSHSYCQSRSSKTATETLVDSFLNVIFLLVKFLVFPLYSHNGVYVTSSCRVISCGFGSHFRHVASSALIDLCVSLVV